WRDSRTCGRWGERWKDNGAEMRRRRKNMSIRRITIGWWRASDSERNRLWPNEFPRCRKPPQPFSHRTNAGLKQSSTFTTYQGWGLRTGVGLRKGGHHHAEMEE